MVEIEHLRSHQAPPEGEAYIMVVQTHDGVYVHAAAGEIGFRIEGPYASLEAAFVSAQSRATEKGLDVIYAKGVAHA